MHRRHRFFLIPASMVLSLAIAASPLVAQQRPSAAERAREVRTSGTSAAFDRGEKLRPGVLPAAANPDVCTRVFEPLPDGGRIELQVGVDDSDSIAAIRRDLRALQRALARGDLAAPAAAALRDAPGARAMAANHAKLSWRYADLPRGGELRVKSASSEAIVALHQFLAFQRREWEEGK